jgi:multidrug efflux pump subunit AcrA (membrane-fusion protein)
MIKPHKHIVFKYQWLTFVLLFLLIACGKKKEDVKPERKDITETVFASGTLEPENKYNLTAQSEGYIVELKFDYGDTVKAGQTLAIIENKPNTISAASAEALLGLAGMNASPEGPTLKQAQQNVELLKDRAKQDSIQYQRYQKLMQSNSVSKLEFENAKLAFESSKTNYLNALQNYRLMKQQTEQQLVIQRSQRDVNSVSSENNQVKAVLGGKIYKRMKETGDYVRRGDIIAVIGDPGDLYAKLSVDESNIIKVQPGQEAIVQLNTNKEKNFTGKVTEIYPYFDDATQSFYCKVKFKDEPELKISGIQLQANIVVGRKANALVIPKTYLGYGNKVNVKGKGPVQVQTGFISGEWVEILSGVDESAVLLSDQNK